MVIAPKKPKNPRLVLTVNVVLDDFVGTPIVVTLPKTATVGTVVDTVTQRFAADYDEEEWGWACPHLEVGFMTEEGVLIDELPPWSAGDAILPFVREAKPMRLVLRLSAIYIATLRCSEEEASGRAGVQAEQLNTFAVLLRQSEVEHAASLRRSEIRQAFEQHAEALGGEEHAARTAVGDEEHAALETLRETFWDKLCRFIEMSLANTRRLSKLRGRLVEELSAAAELQESLPPPERVREFPLTALHGSAKEPPPPPPPPSLFELTLPKPSELTILEYIKREVGPAYKPGAPDGLMRTNAPLAELHARRPKAKHMPQPGRGFLTGIDRAAFDRATKEHMEAAAAAVCASELGRRGVKM